MFDSDFGASKDCEVFVSVLLKEDNENSEEAVVAGVVVIVADDPKIDGFVVADEKARFAIENLEKLIVD